MKKPSLRTAKHLNNSNHRVTAASSLFIIALMLAPIMDTLIRIARRARMQWLNPVLYGDSWTFVLRDNERPIQWILSQHNEHRIVWARIATIIETDIFKIPPTSTFIALSLALTLINIYLLFLVCKSVQRQATKLILLWLTCTLLLINPWQWLNFFWEFQTPWIFSNTLVLATTLLLYKYSEASSFWKKIIALLLLLVPWIAIYNSGQGLAISISLIAVTLLISRALFYLSLSSSIFAATIYFWALHYVKPSHHPSIHFDIKFFAAELLGGNWTGLGAIIVGLSFYLAMNKSLHVFTKQLLVQSPYLLFPAIFSVSFVAMNTLSRSGFGLQQAYSSHYVSHTLMTAISLILATAYSIEKGASKYDSLSCWTKKQFLLLSTFILFAEFLLSSHGYLGEWQNGGQFYIKNYLSFRCEAAKSVYPELPFSMQSSCTTDQKWPEQAKRYDYHLGKLPIKPLGWHLDAGKLTESIKMTNQ